jgi:hypothetical protein
VTKNLQDTSVSESIKAISNNVKTENFATYQSGLTVFTITRVAEGSDINDCKGQFENIIKECIAGQSVLLVRMLREALLTLEDWSLESITT